MCIMLVNKICYYSPIHYRTKKVIMLCPGDLSQSSNLNGVHRPQQKELHFYQAHVSVVKRKY